MCSLRRIVFAVVGLSNTKRVTLFPPMGNDWKERIFRLRSARARQTFPRVPGRSSIKTVNSFEVGMVRTSFTSSGNAGRILGLEGWYRDHTPLVSRLHDQSWARIG